MRTQDISPAKSEPSQSAVQPSGSSSRLAAKTEPPTLVVDAMHRGDHTTISDALAAAGPGDRILVRPGLYREGIVIEKPVEIIGDGALDEIVLEAHGEDAILFRISKNLSVAVYIHDGGQGVVEDNDLRGNAKGAWHISPDSEDKVKRARNKE